MEVRWIKKKKNREKRGEKERETGGGERNLKGTHRCGPVGQAVVVLEEAATVLGEALDHLQAGEFVGRPQSAHPPLLQSRGHREQVLQPAVPRHGPHHNSSPQRYPIPKPDKSQPLPKTNQLNS